jgi:hypothetical protein
VIELVTKRNQGALDMDGQPNTYHNVEVEEKGEEATLGEEASRPAWQLERLRCYRQSSGGEGSRTACV